MTEQTQGWFDDPTGRHRTRWFDGSRWTEHVVGPDGAVARDDLQAHDSGLRAPGSAGGGSPTTGGTHAASDQGSQPQDHAEDDVDASATTVIQHPGARSTPDEQPAAQQSAPAQQPAPAQQSAPQHQWGAPPTAQFPAAEQPAQQWGAPQQGTPQQPQGQPSWQKGAQQPQSEPSWQQGAQQPPAQQWGPPQQPQAQPSWGQQPAQQQPWGQQQPQGGAWGYAPSAAAGGQARYAPGPGLAVGAVGLIMVVLSLFAFKWADGSDGKFSGLRKAVSDIPDSVDLSAGQHILVLYTSWAAFVLLGLSVVLVVLAGVPFPQNAVGNTYARIAGALIAGLGAVAQTISVTQAFKGDASPQFGAWLGIAGWIVVAGAFVLGARRVSA